LIDHHSETVARGRGFKALQCAVARTNDRGLAWHERLGYRKIDQRVVRWQDRDGERELDAWIIERRWRRHFALLARFSRLMARWRTQARLSCALRYPALGRAPDTGRPQALRASSDR
jgi:ribosomal protein S18 acetylase RimI-like enzyme